MGKKRKASGKGKARNSRAVPRQGGGNTAFDINSPAAEAFKRIGEKFSGPNAPDGKKVGAAIGKALGEIITKKVNDTGDFAVPLSDKAKASAKADNSGEIVLRTPDSQHMSHRRVRLNPQDAGYEDDPLVTNAFEPHEVTWSWWINENRYPRVVAVYKFGDVLDSERYKVHLDIPSTVTYMRGTPSEAKALAEALLSAYDWGTSWPKVLGADISQPSWKNYSRKTENNPGSPEKEN